MKNKLYGQELNMCNITFRTLTIFISLTFAFNALCPAQGNGRSAGLYSEEELVHLSGDSALAGKHHTSRNDPLWNNLQLEAYGQLCASYGVSSLKDLRRAGIDVTKALGKYWQVNRMRNPRLVAFDEKGDEITRFELGRQTIENENSNTLTVIEKYACVSNSRRTAALLKITQDIIVNQGPVHIDLSISIYGSRGKLKREYVISKENNYSYYPPEIGISDSGQVAIIVEERRNDPNGNRGQGRLLIFGADGNLMHELNPSGAYAISSIKAMSRDYLAIYGRFNGATRTAFVRLSTNEVWVPEREYHVIEITPGGFAEVISDGFVLSPETINIHRSFSDNLSMGN